MTKETQCQKILHYLEDHDYITALDAMKMGILRLASRVHDLRKRGYEIRSAFVSTSNADGDPVRYKRYWYELGH